MIIMLELDCLVAIIERNLEVIKVSQEEPEARIVSHQEEMKATRASQEEFKAIMEAVRRK
jgi:hypothetical protein